MGDDPFIIWETLTALLSREVKLNIKKAPLWQTNQRPGDQVGRCYWQEMMRAEREAWEGKVGGAVAN